MTEVNYYSDQVLSMFGLYDFTDKKSAVCERGKQMLARTMEMFRYDGLPDTIPSRTLELYLQTRGYAGVFRYDGAIWCAFGGLGGEPDPNYNPTVFTVSNPALRYSANLRIDKECVIVRNDSLYNSIVPILNRYNTALIENELSMNIADINARIISLITAPDDRTKAAAEKYLQDIIDGKLGVIAENAFLEGIRTQPYANQASSQIINSLIEYEQYTKASLFNELGLDSNYNMKRESLTSTESDMNQDALIPLIDNMLRERKEGVERINKMFGTNISVDLNSAWEDNQEEIDDRVGPDEKADDSADDTADQGGEEHDQSDETE